MLEHIWVPDTASDGCWSLRASAFGSSSNVLSVLKGCLTIIWADCVYPAYALILQARDAISVQVFGSKKVGDIALAIRTVR